ncbi:hypothetical protein OSB04_001891 [Centaurea solstitialis]|uniref:F-box domain-containing protein n=1 Tax=Centaurea solstitialis TaxID=347529 RepID=A0AA38WSX3_9ASTR|nr:hypothetical protein OSB04_001891 [Centaurea solstitialis]
MEETAMEMAEEGNNNNQPTKITPKKRIKMEEEIMADDEEEEQQEEDRISALPDCLILEIISHLPSTKTAIRTGTLSKRWKHLWTSVPTLIFKHNNDDNRSNFVSFVNKTLAQCHQSKLKKFGVYTSYDVRFETEVNNWILYAISRSVESLDLILWSFDLEAEFLLNQCFFTNSCFTDLTLAGCVFNPIGMIRWKSLRNLCISFGNLDEDLIENVLSGSPVLETLVLDNCYGYRRLDLTSKSLKNLVFSGYMVPDDESDDLDDVIEINAPNLLSLTIQDDLLLWKIVLLNVSSLVEANLDYTKGGHCETIPKDAEEEMLKGFIQSLSHVKELKIGVFCCKVLSRLEAKGFIFPSNVKFPDCTSAFYSDNDSLGQGDLSDSDSVESSDWDVLLLDHGSKGDEFN